MEMDVLAGRFEAIAANLGNGFGKAFAVLGEEMVREARGLVPVRTGRLRDSIGWKWNEARNTFTFFTKKAPYAWAVERGKDLTAKKGAYLVFDAGSGVRKIKSVKHPAHPFMTRVFNERFFPEGEKNLQQFINILLEEIEGGLS
jgi:hypothetical protein